MDVKNNRVQPQLLQRTTQQHNVKASVQEEVIVPKDQDVTKEKMLSKVDEKEKLKQVTDSLNEFILPLKTSLKFEFHEKLEEYYVTIVDNRTKEVLKEIPSKKMLDLYASIAESLGLIVDHKI